MGHEAGGGRRAALRRMGREGVATIRLINHSPSPIAGVRRARGWIPGDRRFGDPLSTTSSYRQIEAVGRRLGLRAEEHGALREAGFGALQVWQWLLEVSGRGRDERLLTIVFTDLVDFSSWAVDAGDCDTACVRATARPHLAREEIEQLRRSIAMLQPGSLAMTREDALRLLSELGEVRGRLDRLCNGLRALLEEER